MGQASSFALQSIERAVGRYEQTQKCVVASAKPADSSLLTPLPKGFDWNTSAPSLTVAQLRVVAAFLPECLANVDLHHLPLLFVLDSDRDGVFSPRDLKEFVSWATEALPMETPLDDVAEVLRGHTVLRCWNASHLESGERDREGKKPLDDHQSHRACAYFACWVTRLLHFSEMENIATVDLPSLPPDPSSGAFSHLPPGAVGGKEENTLCTTYVKGAKQTHVVKDIGEENLYKDPNLQPNADIALSASKYCRPSEKHQDCTLYQPEWHRRGRGKLQYISLGLKALEELYHDLSTEELYGLSFWGFCQTLNPTNAAEIEYAAKMQRDDVTNAWTNHKVAAHQSQPEQDELILSIADSSFYTPLEVVEDFVMCFCKAYWNTLIRLGLRHSDGAVRD